MDTEQLYSNADLIGRLKVIYALQMKDPDLQITSMPITTKWDLEIYNKKTDTTNYLEIKDRDCDEDEYDTAMLNIEKYENLSGYGSNFWYVCSYTSGELDFWQPTEMPRTGITENEFMITTSTVEQKPKKKQRRYCLNFNDKRLQLHNKLKINIMNDEQ